MDPTLSATCEALDFFLSSREITLTEKRVLIIQGTPAEYIEHFKTCEIDVISYNAAVVASWERRQIPSKQVPEGNYDLIIHFAAKTDKETQFELDRSLQHIKEGGVYIGVVHNRMGATRFKKQLQAIFPELDQESKSKCRVFAAAINSNSRIPSAPVEDQTFRIGDSDYASVAGVYGENQIDAGSELLASILRQEYWSGMGADIGCGYGYLSGEILKTRHKVKQLWLYEIDSRALQLAERNLKEISPNIQLHNNWTDVTTSIPTEREFHWAIMNPPFHTGTAQDFALGQKFIEQAASVLKSGAPLFMVANLHLPYEETLHQNFRSVVKLVEQDGFKCFKAIK